MRARHLFSFFGRTPVTVAAACLAVVPASLLAQGSKDKNPSSKVYVTDVNGTALIDTGDAIEDLTKRSVYTAQGTVIETKRSEDPADDAKHFSTMVYSNGTGAFYDVDTRVEVRKFSQEPFRPDRQDMEVEPSMTETQAFVARGTVGLCNSKMVAGSTMAYQTAQGVANIRGQKVVIEAGQGFTKISMLEGDSTVKAGPQDMGGHLLESGYQAIIRNGQAGAPNSIEIIPIPRDEMPGLDDKVTMACNAKKAVYFDVRERSETNNPNAAGGNEVAGGSNGNGEGGDAPITAFDGNSATSSVTVREIVPIEVVPTNLPVQFTISPAKIVAPATGG